MRVEHMRHENMLGRMRFAGGPEQKHGSRSSSLQQRKGVTMEGVTVKGITVKDVIAKDVLVKDVTVLAVLMLNIKFHQHGPDGRGFNAFYL